MELDTDLLVRHLSSVTDSFAPDELAFLALTSKVELPIRDRLAWSLQSALWPSWIVSREWRRTDLAILSPTPPCEPALLLEAKAMYTFDAVSTRQWALYSGYVRDDLRKAAALAPKAMVFGLLFATHPHAVANRHLRDVVKYVPGVAGAIRRLGGAAAVRTEAASAVGAELSALGPITSGSFEGGSAFDVEVAIDYWLVGPVSP